MKSHSIRKLLFLIIIFSSPHIAFAEEVEPISYPPQALCLPGIYLAEENPDCLLLGPAEYLTQIAWMKAEIVSQSIRYTQIDPSYGSTHLTYLKLNQDNPRYKYSSLEDAIRGGKRSSTLAEGNAYVSYVTQVTNNNKNYYELPDGSWIRSGAIASFAEPNMFRGVLTNGTPERIFGWILLETETRSKPGYYKNTGTGNILPRHTIIEAFEVVKIGKSNWYMIAPNEWIFQTEVALVVPAHNSPKGVTNNRWIDINLFEQTLAVYRNGEMVFATLTTTGASRTATRPGLFNIYERHLITNMAGGDKDKGDYYNLKDVPWTMYFDERRALHAEYWHDHLGYRSSHGCVNLSFPDAQWLFEWAEMGDWVYVWDIED